MNNEQRIPVLDRVRKLLALSANTTNEHEASLAAARAAALMARHEIHEAELRALDEAAVVRTPEPIDNLRATGDRGKRVAWHLALAWGVSRRLHCHYYTRAGAIFFFGRLTAIQTASYLLAYLTGEVERLARQADLRGKAEHGAFKLGCAQRVAQRLIATPRVVRESPRDLATDATDEVPFDEAPEAGPAPSAGALVLIQRDREEVDAAWQAKVKGWGAGRRVGRVSNHGAYARGKAAGDSANLGGGARAGLPAGRGVLR